jgi:hypothetical protein
MKSLELKRDPWVIIPYTLFVVMALAGLIWKKLDWPQFLAIIGALNVASVFGLKKGDEDRPTPPAPPPPPVNDEDSGSQVRENLPSFKR